MFRFSGFELRQDPQSHHLILYYSPLNFQPGGIDVHDPSFGAWTCAGGERAGEACEPDRPRRPAASGLCRSELQGDLRLHRLRPAVGQPARRSPVGGAQQAQAYIPFHDGVFAQIPMKGVIYWNSHAFNLTDERHGDERAAQLPASPRTSATRCSASSTLRAIFRPNAPPYTEQTVCNDHVLPAGRARCSS